MNEAKHPDETTVSQRLASGIATLAGLGRLGKAPGTNGSAIATILLYLSLTTEQSASAFWLSYLLIILGLSLVGVWATKIHSDRIGIHDAGEIIIDEVAGIWLTAAIAHGTLWFAVASSLSSDPYHLNFAPHSTASLALFCLLIFGSFRLFDILKPGPIRSLDENIGGAWGVMIDDLAAAVPAGLLAGLVFVIFDLVS